MARETAPLVTPAADRLAACKMKWRSDLAEGERGFTSYCQGRKARKLKIAEALKLGKEVIIQVSKFVFHHITPSSSAS